VERLLADPVSGRAAGQRGRAVVERHRGALAALLGHIEQLLFQYSNSGALGGRVLKRL